MLKFKKIKGKHDVNEVRYDVYRDGNLLHSSFSKETIGLLSKESDEKLIKTIILEAIDYLQFAYKIVLDENEKKQIKNFFSTSDKPKTDTFIGTGSGDCECFCWDVDLETYKKYHRGWEEDVKERQEVNISQGYPKNQGVYDGTWRLYHQDIERLLDLKRKKHKITITFEEAEDEI